MRGERRFHNFYGAYSHWLLYPDQRTTYYEGVELLYRVLYRMRNADADTVAQMYLVDAWREILDEKCIQETF